MAMPRAVLLLLFLLPLAGLAAAEEIPLESCDLLPVMQVDVSGRKYLFLVDTAATSMLNLKSFRHGDQRKMSVTSWSGTTETNAQEVTLSDLAMGHTHFKNLKLPAVDLTAIGRTCGRQIDGIFGIDLLGKLGATVDLKDHKARLLVASPDSVDTRTAERIAELHQQLVACEQAFNADDEAAFSDCLDPQIVLFTVGGDFYGREAAMNYYRQRYFQQKPTAQLAIVPRAHHPLGDAIWVEYDLRITVAHQVIVARGTALCQKTGGKWRIVHMNHSSPPAEAFQAQAR